MDNKHLIQEIVQGILDFKIIPFFGAGMSVPFGFKDWDTLIEEMRAELGTDEEGNLNVAQLYEDKFGRNQLIQKLKECYSIDDIKTLPTDNHQLILSMTPPVIYTTNYDEGIEQTASLVRREYYKVACLKDVVNMPHGANIVVKFHGDFSAEEEIVLTENDYEKRMEAENALDILFRSHLLGKSMFFMGYGLRDKNIDFIFKKHAALYGSENLPTSYIVVFKDKYTPELEEEFQQKNIQTIVLDSPNELRDILRQINKDVYQGDFNRQSERMFESYPEELLLISELENLEEYMNSDQYMDIQKAEKIEETLSMKLIPNELQERAISLLSQIIRDTSFSIDAMDIILRTLQWAQIHPHYAFDLGMDLVALTERPEYQMNLNNLGSRFIFPIQTLEKIYKDIGTVLCILAYLVKCNKEGKKLDRNQLHDLKDTLQSCKYGQHDFGAAMPPEDRDAILRIHYPDYSNWKNEHRITPRRSLNDIYSEMMKNFPKDFDGR